jgi:hypothetical protein
VAPVPGFTYAGQTDPYNSVPDGPANWQDSVTRADGTGEVAVQLFTRRESASLGCDAAAPCSLVVVPNYGQPQGATEDLMDAPWAWERRTVVPLQFLPIEDACPLAGEALRIEGTPFIAHAFASWRARTCTLAADPVRLDYTAIGEPQIRADVAAGTSDVGLFVDPMDADAAAGRGIVYAPVSVTGLVVAFQIDDADGKPVSSLRLNPRLVTKLITASYRSGADEAVINNPVNLFRDPEFLDLNPGTVWPGGAPGNHPLLLGDLSDSTLALTRWIAADKDAAAFLAGKPDPWGMTVNTNYKDVELPFAGFQVLDPLLSQTFEPIQELDTVARQLSIARFPGAVTSVENGVTVVTKPPRQNPGRREVIGIIDAAAAARFRLSTASLQNASGAFVAPSVPGYLAAIKHATVGEDGVSRAVDTADKDAAAYPLTMQVTAALSTRATKSLRAKMVRFLSYVADAGQQPGEELGQLPEGHAPLPATLVKQVALASKAVAEGAPEQETEPVDGTGTGEDGTGAGGAPGSGGEAPPIEGPASVTEPEVTAAPDATQPETGTAKTPRTATPEPSRKPVPTTVRTAGPLAAEDPLLVLPVLGGLAIVTLIAGQVLWHISRKGGGLPWLRR